MIITAYVQIVFEKKYLPFPFLRYRYRYDEVYDNIMIILYESLDIKLFYENNYDVFFYEIFLIPISI